MDEYRQMFALSEVDLQGKILDCAGGPASFNAEMTALGYDVLSLDPLYAFSKAEIAQRIDETYATILEQLTANQHDYIWSHFADPAALGAQRRTSMELFLADLETGLAAGRYQVGTLPTTGLADKQFDLALCSHFLFLYSEQLTYEFHLAAIQELCRVAHEVRIFPLLAMDCSQSPYVEPIQHHCADLGLTATIEQVPYEFQRGGTQMLKIM